MKAYLGVLEQHEVEILKCWTGWDTLDLIFSGAYKELLIKTQHMIKTACI